MILSDDKHAAYGVLTSHEQEHETKSKGSQHIGIFKILMNSYKSEKSKKKTYFLIQKTLSLRILAHCLFTKVAFNTSSRDGTSKSICESISSPN